MRFFLDISYRGTAFHGWQIQKNAHSVQEVINTCLSQVLGLKIQCIGSSRTDTGVHAEHQVAHFDLNLRPDLSDLRYKLNAILPPEISINGIREVRPEVHCRFQALSRTYLYHIHQSKDPFKAGVSYYFPVPLDIQAIEDALQVVRKWENFQAFSKVKTDVNHFLCQILDARWDTFNNTCVFSVRANRFLRGMVRTLVGTLLDIGQHRLSTDDLVNILELKKRTGAGRSVPAEGLFLHSVEYPSDIYINK